MINIEENKKVIIDLLKNTERKGIDNILDYMENNGFYTAPCSTRYHLCVDGGLAEHSLKVYNMMDELVNKSFVKYFNMMCKESIIITSILHDLGKAGYRGESLYKPNYLKSGGIGKAPYTTNKDRLWIDHEIVSLNIIYQCGLEITAEEEHAILFHNGLYTNTGKGVINNERPLQQLLHFADMWSSRFLEKE